MDEKPIASGRLYFKNRQIEDDYSSLNSEEFSEFQKDLFAVVKKTIEIMDSEGENQAEVLTSLVLNSGKNIILEIQFDFKNEPKKLIFARFDFLNTDEYLDFINEQKNKDGYIQKKLD